MGEIWEPCTRTNTVQPFDWRNNEDAENPLQHKQHGSTRLHQVLDQRPWHGSGPQFGLAQEASDRSQIPMAAR
jgi:hypothetical protein